MSNAKKEALTEIQQKYFYVIFYLGIIMTHLSVCSHRDREHKFRGRPPPSQSAFASSTTPCLQTLLCVSGQIFRIPLWSQCL